MKEKRGLNGELIEGTYRVPVPSIERAAHSRAIDGLSSNIRICVTCKKEKASMGNQCGVCFCSGSYAP